MSRVVWVWIVELDVHATGERSERTNAVVGLAFLKTIGEDNDLLGACEMDVLVDELRYDRMPCFADRQECCSRGQSHGPIDIDTTGLGEGVEAV